MSTSSTFNNASPIFNVDNSLSNLVDDLNLINSKQDDPLCFSTYYSFPSPMSTYYNNEFEGFDDFLHHYHHHDQVEGSIEQVIRATSSAITDDSSIFEADNNKKGSSKVEEGNTNSTKRPTSATSNGTKRRRRSSNKDRHSKIRTAQGLRDRRMRLSLEVAHPFFKLQDMLGYDKASKTVEWLLVQSKEAIEEVCRRSQKQGSPSGVTKCTISSISDCEVESIRINQQKKEKGPKKTKRSFSSSTSASKSKIQRKPNRTTKESRAEARDRARERTRKRLIMTSNKQVNMDKNDEQHVDKSPLLGHSTSFQMMEIHQCDSNNYNGIYQPSIEIPEQANGTLAGNHWNSLFTTFNYLPKW